MKSIYVALAMVAICTLAKSQTIDLKGGVGAFHVPYNDQASNTYQKEISFGPTFGLDYTQRLSKVINLSLGLEWTMHQTQESFSVVYESDAPKPDTFLAATHKNYYVRVPLSFSATLRLDKAQRFSIRPTVGFMAQRNAAHRVTYVETGAVNVYHFHNTQVFGQAGIELNYRVNKNLGVSLGAKGYFDGFKDLFYDYGFVDGYSSYLSAGWTFNCKHK